MKIEKISENQIRCTLTRDDLASRKIRLSEFVYGSEKAKKLFKELMDQAAMQYGFEGEGVPIMVEAIPTNAAALVLVITRVENPEELDARFSKFTPHEDGEEQADEEAGDIDVFSSNELEQLAPTVKSAIKDLLTEVTRRIKEESAAQGGKEEKKHVPKEATYRTFVFTSLDKTVEFVKVIRPIFFGNSSLYKDTKNHRYFLVVFFDNQSAEAFNSVCNIGCEYTSVISNDSLQFYNEHYKLIAKNDAIDRLDSMM